ncbi:MAG: hypothetical protein JSV49_00350 [Thermoplasmata archaeon]|nr:MAG: hypothetical protein JSV49_00350 [Thermoplasmata archaeon]
MKGRRRYRIRTGARTASKVQEKDLIQKAKHLKKNPELIIPYCDQHCRFCPFEKVRRQVEQISEKADDKRILTKLTSKGDPIARAYAATLLLAIKGEVPFLAVFRTPLQEVTYAYRSNCKKEKLIGVQYYDDPILRMLSVLDIVKKKGIYIYSLDKKMVCTGKTPDPPQEFIDQMISSLKTGVKGHKFEDSTIYTCTHLDVKKVRDESPAKQAYLKINWLSADTALATCERCAKHSKENIYMKLVLRIAAKDVSKDFEISVIAKPLVETKCPVCSELDEIPIEPELLEKYTKGIISDKDLIEEHWSNFKSEMISSGKKHFILDHICYGTNLKEFINQLEPDEHELIALKTVLKKVPKAVVVSKVTPNKVLTMYWQEFGREAIYSVTNDREFSKKMFKKHDVNKVPPSQILKESSGEFKHINVIKALPSYDKLPAVAKFADEMARTYKTRGADDTARAIEHYRSTDTRIKSIAFGFLLALNKGSSKKWQYTTTEIEFAQFLKKPVQSLLKAEPDDYHKALQELLRATGSTEEIKPKNG